jgi:hypothetical protein
MRIRPLEWFADTESICTRAFAPALGGKMIVVELDPGSGEYSAGIDLGGLCFRFIQARYEDGIGGYSAPAKYPSLEAAKAAAHADYEARVRACLVEGPTPDAVLNSGYPLQPYIDPDADDNPLGGDAPPYVARRDDGRAYADGDGSESLVEGWCLYVRADLPRPGTAATATATASGAGEKALREAEDRLARLEAEAQDVLAAYDYWRVDEYDREGPWEALEDLRAALSTPTKEPNHDA